MTRILPITFELGPVRPVVESPNEQLVRDAARAFFARQSFTINGKVSTGNGVYWCELLEGEAHRDDFLDKRISTEELEALRNINQLNGMLGEPLVAEGPIDGGGTIIYQWRTLAFEQGGHPIVREVTAALRPAKTQMLFLWVRTERRK